MKQIFIGFLVLGAASFFPISGLMSAELTAQQEALRHCGGMTRCAAIVQVDPQAAALINACARALHGGSSADAALCDNTVFARLLSGSASHASLE